MSDEAIRLYIGSKDPISGKFGMTPEQAQSQAQGFRAGSTPAAPTPQAAPAAPAAPAMPEVGETRGGYTFKGGNPADPKSWQQVQ